MRRDLKTVSWSMDAIVEKHIDIVIVRCRFGRTLQVLICPCLFAWSGEAGTKVLTLLRSALLTFAGGLLASAGLYTDDASYVNQVCSTPCPRTPLLLQMRYVRGRKIRPGQHPYPVSGVLFQATPNPLWWPKRLGHTIKETHFCLSGELPEG